MTDKVGLVILAAGEGKRMKSKDPKPLLDLMGKKIIDYPLSALKTFLGDSSREGHIAIVVGHESQKIVEYVEGKGGKFPLFFVTQKYPGGTADALKAYLESPRSRGVDDLLVMCVDTPLIDASDIEKLYKAFKKDQWNALLASAIMESPGGHGRIVRKSGENGLKIVEERDASDEIKKVKEVNSGLYCFKRQYALDRVKKVSNNNAVEEYYLTDIFGFHDNVEALVFDHAETFQGINTMEQLHGVERILRSRKLSQLIRSGVRIMDTHSTFIDEDALVDPGAVIHPNVIIQGKSHIKSLVFIESGVVIKDTTIDEGTLVKTGSYITGSKIGKYVSLGPYAHLRPETIIEDSCRVGTFVEIKKSHLSKGVKVPHLSYVGDAEIGEATNIGCGFITCNYDGTKKHKTIIGKKSFIGSDTQTIAPVTIGNHCYVASGSTINKSMEDGDFAIARSRQVNKRAMAKKFFDPENPKEPPPHDSGGLEESGS